MLHYLALLWNPADPAQQAAGRLLARTFEQSSAGWKATVVGPGSAVFHNTGSVWRQPYFMPDGQSVVFGRLFERGLIAAVPGGARFDAAAGEAILASGGRELLTRYWGEYVAFLHDAPTGTHRVLRDPGGALPCQWTRIEGIDVYFTRIEDCERLKPPLLSLNRRYLLGYLMYDSAGGHDTGCNEVKTVLAGECIEHRNGRRTSLFYWNPLQIAGSILTEDAAEAVRLMRETVRMCVYSWASCFDRIALRLSGGLDSSIVLACLAEAPTRPAVVCINNYDEATAAADERAFARQAAAKAGCRLVEWQTQRGFSLDTVKHSGLVLSPHPCIANPVAVRTRLEFLRENGVGAVFSGVGGDEVFYRGGRLPVATDFLWRHGLRRDLLSIATNDAAAMSCSFWRVLRIASRHGLLRKPWIIRMQVPPNYRPLMTGAAHEAARRDAGLWHPLYRDAAQIPPAKFAQAYALSLSAARFYIPHPAEAFHATVSPLLAQPLLELSLRIPTYVLKADGRDRAIARRAFADSVPPAIIQRSTKGTDSEYLRALVENNLPLLRETLLGGYLVQERLIDPVALEAALSGRPTDSQSYTLEILDYLNVETWIRSWTQTGRRRAA